MRETATGRQSNRTATEPGDGTRERDELRAEIARLAAENERLREAYARSKRATYRKSAAGLAGLGLVAVAGGFALPHAQSVLFVLGAIGLFGAVLTAYLTPERFVAASVGRAVYGALADNEAALAAELGLAEAQYYVPTGPGRGVRLFVPQAGTDRLPASSDLETTLVATESAVGLALDPSGADLFREFEASLAGELADGPAAIADQLAEALAEQFELVGSASADIDATAGRATVALSGSAYGRVDRFDHPVASFLAAGLARGIDQPVAVDVTDGDDGWIVTCRWVPGGDDQVGLDAFEAAPTAGASAADDDAEADDAEDDEPEADEPVPDDRDDAASADGDAHAPDAGPESDPDADDGRGPDEAAGTGTDAGGEADGGTGDDADAGGDTEDSRAGATREADRTDAGGDS